MASDSGDFQLAASLSGHDKDVRAVCFPVPDAIFTASRDCSVQAWHQTSSSPPAYSPTLLMQGQYSFNSLAYLPPSQARPEYPNGLILAGSQGQTIEVRKPDSNISEPPVHLLSGHASNVSTLDVSPSGSFVVSGDWDGRARVWDTSTWTVSFELTGTDPDDKRRAIWAVLAYSNTVVITGSADNMIRGYTLQGATAGQPLSPGVQIRTPDVVRALCRVRKHPSDAKIASAGNDFLIRLWQFNGAQVGTLQGHESFIYAIDCLPSGEIVSSSEDRTVRVWKGESCVQTITHPALSIWSVSVCQQTGDFVTGASDNTARVFSRNLERVASPEVLRQFSDLVQRSAIPQQQVGDINKSTLPGPEFLEKKSGTKDGQTVMINGDDGNISVYQWSAGQNQWLLVGSVVDTATDDVGGASFASSAPVSSPVLPVQPPKSSAAAVPHPMGQRAVFVTLAQSNFTPVLKRIHTVNSGISQSAGAAANPAFVLDTEQLASLNSIAQLLEKELPHIPTTFLASGPPPARGPTLEPASVELVLKLATLWPYKDRLPCLDLLRCMAVSESVATFTDGQGRGPLDVVLPSVLGFPKNASTGMPEDIKAAENNSMMALRFIANLFATDAGQKHVAKKADEVASFVSSVLDFSERKNRNLMIALVSAAGNVTSLALQQQEKADQPGMSRDALLGIIKILAVPIVDLVDTEVVYRALVALGNLTSIQGDFGCTEQVRSTNARTWISLAMSRMKEDRIQSVGDKILKLLE